MDAKRILKFLSQLMANNNRPWFQEHKKEYDAVRADFEQGIAQAIERIMTFDPEIAHLQVKDCTYRWRLYRCQGQKGIAWRLLSASGT